MSGLPPTLARVGSVLIPRANIILDNTLPDHLLTLPDQELATAKTNAVSKKPADILNELNTKMNEAIIALPAHHHDIIKNSSTEELSWNPEPGELYQKNLDSESHDYLLRTIIVANNLGLIIESLCEWKKKDIEEGGVLILDILNIFRTIARMFFGNDTSYSYEIYLLIKFVIIDYIRYKPNLKKIILCVQNHLLTNSYFINFVSDLENFMLNRNRMITRPIFILPGHNRASGDDILGLVAYVTFTKLYGNVITLLTGDGYKDFTSKYITKEEFKNEFIQYLNNNFYRIQSEIPREILREILRKISKVGPMRSVTTKRAPGPYDRRFTSYGGTNKNKYTRKIKNSKKVKTLHKKHNTSKKVVKKYNKYNKNYKKKTLRRKNK